MAREFPASRFHGVDISEEGIAAAWREAEQIGNANVRFEVRDAASLDVTREYDLITTFDAVHDQAHRARCSARSATR